MPLFEEMSSDRMMACRIFDGEIHRIKAVYNETDKDWPYYETIINYLQNRIESMKEKEHYR